MLLIPQYDQGSITDLFQQLKSFLYYTHTNLSLLQSSNQTRILQFPSHPSSSDTAAFHQFSLWGAPCCTPQTLGDGAITFSPQIQNSQLPFLSSQTSQSFIFQTRSVLEKLWSIRECSCAGYEGPLVEADSSGRKPFISSFIPLIKGTKPLEPMKNQCQTQHSSPLYPPALQLPTENKTVPSGIFY